MIKIAAVVLSALFMNILLREYSKQFVLPLNIAAAAALLVLISDDISGVADGVRLITDNAGAIAPYIKIMLKILGVSVASGFLSDLCRDNGAGALANQTELAAKVIVLITALPMFKAVIDIITGILK